MHLQKSLHSIAPGDTGLGADVNEQQMDVKSQPMVVVNNQQVIGVLGADKVQAVPVQGIGNQIIKIAANPQIVPKQSMMTVLNQAALDKQLSGTSSIVMPNLLCTTQLPQIANANVTGLPNNMAAHLIGGQ